MTLLEFITYFRKGGNFESFCTKHKININSDIIDLYMEKPFGITANIVFLELDQTLGAEMFKMEGKQYYNLFDLYYFLDLIKESTNSANAHISDEKTAEILLAHAIKSRLE